MMIGGCDIQGTHQELIEKQGIFWKMVQAQTMQGPEETHREGDDDVVEDAKEQKKDAKSVEEAEDKKQLPSWELTKWAWAQSKPDMARILFSFVGSLVLAIE